MRIFISVIPFSSVNPMLDRLLESSHRDDSNKWSNIGFTEEITQVVPIELFFFLFVIFNRGSSLGLPQCSYGAEDELIILLKSTAARIFICTSLQIWLKT